MEGKRRQEREMLKEGKEGRGRIESRERMRKGSEVRRMEKKGKGKGRKEERKKSSTGPVGE